MKKGKNNLIKWVIVGLLIIAAIIIAYKVFTGQVVNANAVSASTCNGASNSSTINTGTLKTINGLNVSVLNSTSIGNIQTATVLVAGKTYSLILNTVSAAASNPNAQQIINLGSYSDLVTLVSGSNTQATIKVTSCLPCKSKGMLVNSASQCCSGSIRTISFWGFHLNYCN